MIGYNELAAAGDRSKEEAEALGYSLDDLSNAEDDWTDTCKVNGLDKEGIEKFFEEAIKNAGESIVLSAQMSLTETLVGAMMLAVELGIRAARAELAEDATL